MTCAVAMGGLLAAIRDLLSVPAPESAVDIAVAHGELAVRAAVVHAALADLLRGPLDGVAVQAAAHVLREQADTMPVTYPTVARVMGAPVAVTR